MTYIKLSDLPQGAAEEVLKRRIVKEFSDSFHAEQRGGNPALTTEALRPYYKQAIGNNPSGADRGRSSMKKDLMTLGQRLLDSDIEEANRFGGSGFAEDILDGLGKKGR